MWFLLIGFLIPFQYLSLITHSIGEILNLVCLNQTTNLTDHNYVKWYHNNTKIAAGNTIRFKYRNRALAEKNQIIIKNLTSKDSGIYRCVIENGTDYDNQTYTVSIKNIPFVFTYFETSTNFTALLPITYSKYFLCYQLLSKFSATFCDVDHSVPIVNYIPNFNIDLNKIDNHLFETNKFYFNLPTSSVSAKQNRNQSRILNIHNANKFTSYQIFAINDNYSVQKSDNREAKDFSPLKLIFIILDPAFKRASHIQDLNIITLNAATEVNKNSFTKLNSKRNNSKIFINDSNTSTPSETQLELTLDLFSSFSRHNRTNSIDLIELLRNAHALSLQIDIHVVLYQNINEIQDKINLDKHKQLLNIPNHNIETNINNFELTNNNKTYNADSFPQSTHSLLWRQNFTINSFTNLLSLNDGGSSLIKIRISFNFTNVKSSYPTKQFHIEVSTIVTLNPNSPLYKSLFGNNNAIIEKNYSVISELASLDFTLTDDNKISIDVPYTLPFPGKKEKIINIANHNNNKTIKPNPNPNDNVYDKINNSIVFTLPPRAQSNTIYNLNNFKNENSLIPNTVVTKSSLIHKNKDIKVRTHFNNVSQFIPNDEISALKDESFLYNNNNSTTPIEYGKPNKIFYIGKEIDNKTLNIGSESNYTLLNISKNLVLSNSNFLVKKDVGNFLKRDDYAFDLYFIRERHQTGLLALTGFAICIIFLIFALFMLFDWKRYLNRHKYSFLSDSSHQTSTAPMRHHNSNLGLLNDDANATEQDSIYPYSNGHLGSSHLLLQNNSDGLSLNIQANANNEKHDGPHNSTAQEFALQDAPYVNHSHIIVNQNINCTQSQSKFQNDTLLDNGNSNLKTNLKFDSLDRPRPTYNYENTAYDPTGRMCTENEEPYTQSKNVFISQSLSLLPKHLTTTTTTNVANDMKGDNTHTSSSNLPCIRRPFHKGLFHKNNADYFYDSDSNVLTSLSHTANDTHLKNDIENKSIKIKAKKSRKSSSSFSRDLFYGRKQAQDEQHPRHRKSEPASSKQRNLFSSTLETNIKSTSKSNTIIQSSKISKSSDLFLRSSHLFSKTLSPPNNTNSNKDVMMSYGGRLDTNNKYSQKALTSLSNLFFHGSFTHANTDDSSHNTNVISYNKNQQIATTESLLDSTKNSTKRIDENFGGTIFEMIEPESIYDPNNTLLCTNPTNQQQSQNDKNVSSFDQSPLKFEYVQHSTNSNDNTPLSLNESVNGSRDLSENHNLNDSALPNTFSNSLSQTVNQFFRPIKQAAYNVFGVSGNENNSANTDIFQTSNDKISNNLAGIEISGSNLKNSNSIAQENDGIKDLSCCDIKPVSFSTCTTTDKNKSSTKKRQLRMINKSVNQVLTLTINALSGQKSNLADNNTSHQGKNSSGEKPNYMSPFNDSYGPPLLNGLLESTIGYDQKYTMPYPPYDQYSQQQPHMMYYGGGKMEESYPTFLQNKIIHVSEFAQRVKHLHSNSDQGFCEQFNAIVAASRTFANQLNNNNNNNHPASHAIGDTRAKNRYANIFAYPHTRVAIDPMSNNRDTLCDYINANFIEGYGEKENAYIATQGPLPNTIVDFWRMIWQHKIESIVMITNLVERGKVKCDKYWPDQIGGTTIYGDNEFAIDFLAADTRAYYTIRTFRVRKILPNASTAESKQKSNNKFVIANTIMSVPKTKPPPPNYLVLSDETNMNDNFINSDSPLVLLRRKSMLDSLNNTTSSNNQNDPNSMFLPQIYGGVDKCLSADNSCLQTPNNTMINSVSSACDFRRAPIVYFERHNTSNNNNNNNSCMSPSSQLMESTKTDEKNANNSVYRDSMASCVISSTLSMYESELSDALSLVHLAPHEEKADTLTLKDINSPDTFTAHNTDLHNINVVQNTYTSNNNNNFNCHNNQSKTENMYGENNSTDSFIVKQYHYTEWPDHGVPQFIMPLLNFINLCGHSAIINQNENGRHNGRREVEITKTLVVHCSAGVGRTGTFFVLDTMLSKLLSAIYAQLIPTDKDSIVTNNKLPKLVEMGINLDIYDYLSKIRTQRNHLVQTEEQYIFIHDALDLALKLNYPIHKPAMSFNDLNVLLSVLKQSNTEATESLNDNLDNIPALLLKDKFELELKALLELNVDYGLHQLLNPNISNSNVNDYANIPTHAYMTALCPYNLSKNRLTNPLHTKHNDMSVNSKIPLPNDMWRVYLTPKPTIPGSDYINATYLEGYFGQKDFIVTEHPSIETQQSFWRMIWENNVAYSFLLLPSESFYHNFGSNSSTINNNNKSSHHSTPIYSNNINSNSLSAKGNCNNNSTNTTVFPSNSSEEFLPFWPTVENCFTFDGIRIHCLNSKARLQPDETVTKQDTNGTDDMLRRHFSIINFSLESENEDYQLLTKIYICNMDQLPSWFTSSSTETNLNSSSNNNVEYTGTMFAMINRIAQIQSLVNEKTDLLHTINANLEDNFFSLNATLKNNENNLNDKLSMSNTEECNIGSKQFSSYPTLGKYVDTKRTTPNQPSPIVIIDKYGSLPSAFMCILTTAFIEYLESLPGHVSSFDLFTPAYNYNIKRPNLITNQDDYYKLHLSMKSLLLSMKSKYHTKE